MSYQEKNNKIKQNQNKQRKGGIQEEAEEGSRKGGRDGGRKEGRRKQEYSPGESGLISRGSKGLHSLLESRQEIGRASCRERV